MTTATIEAADLVPAARAAIPALRDDAGNCERERRLAEASVRALREAGAYRMVMPRAWGGPEADPVTQIRMVEELSIGNASAGWCAMIGSDGGYVTAFLDQQVGRELYRDLDAVTAVVTRPSAVATVVPGGYRVSGQFQFASGCRAATYFVGNCFVHEGGKPLTDQAGAPITRMCLMRMSECEILDTWTTTGLRGTGSHDVAVKEVFVPEEHTFNMVTSPITREGPLYAFRSMYIANGAGVPFGLARAAIDAVKEIAETKTVRLGGGGLRNEPFAHTALARAESLLGSARAYCYDVMGDVWQTLQRGDQPDPQQRAKFRLCMASSSHMSGEAVTLMYQVAGSAALYATNPLDRIMRDMTTVNQHVANQLKVYETAGRMLFGLEPGAAGW
ncbi:MAG: acyl-CoA dehydrogenase family protein [Chloroflexota bacterium]